MSEDYMVKRSSITKIVSIIRMSGDDGMGPSELIEEAELSYGMSNDEARRAMENAIDTVEICVDDDLKMRTSEFVKNKHGIGGPWP
jgi:hypothetical protein